MKESPILMSAPMVRALLAGTKRQTRRVVKPQPFAGAAQEHWSISEFGQFCPYGQPGDRLWVRETFYAFGRWVTQFNAKKGRDEWHFIDMTVECGYWYFYAASEAPKTVATFRRAGATPMWWKRPAIFMPRAASRILLDVIGVRVERLQEISEADAMAEGVTRDEHGWTNYAVPTDCWESPKDSYRTLWESINGPGSWDANPWVWAVSFKRI